MKKLSNKQLATLYARLDRVFIKREELFERKFRDVYDDLRDEINRRNRALIFKETCRCLKLRNWGNQFTYAAHFADSCLDDADYFESNRTYEIGGYYTKSGNPHLVWLVMSEK